MPKRAAAENPLWRPSAAAMRDSAMFRFMQHAATRHGIDENYDALHRWSIRRREEFWPAVWDFTGIIASRRWDNVLENGDAMPGAKWFSGSRLNFAENLLRHCGAGHATDVAILSYREDRAARALTHAELYAEVARVSAWLRELGVRPGERVAAYMSNIPETVIAMLASASIGAIWSSCSPDFGVAGVLERFGQIRPRVLFAVDGYRYNGKRFDLRDAVAAISRGLDSVRHVIITPLEDAPPPPGMRAFADFTSAPAEIDFAQLPFDHPLCILYSSGTTGAPKCIVHGAGGTLIQHLKEHQLHVGLRRSDVFFFITTCGWMMWNWLVSGLASGCRLVLYDGAPFYPSPRRLWEVAAEARISIFGGGARYIAALAKARVRPREHDLAALRAMLSTGSPLAPESYDYVYGEIKSDLQLASISGGTDIVSCFVLGNPLRPVWRGEIQGSGLGMDVRVFSDGAAARGQCGELVCAKAFPSMPLGFWGEPDERRYRAAYFSRFENIWAQGDFAEITAHDGFIIHGRSDAALNPGGVRIGTAEIYRQVERLDEILESICIGQNWDGDVRIVLFVLLREGAQLDDALKTRIRDIVRENTTRRHIPKKIIAVADIPRTLSGKIVELAVRNIVHEEPVANRAALANPEALEYFRGLAELQVD
ncbi:MAG: acetoacetate--CoA ligase [Gammaproteobacteria bacterium]